MIRIETILCPVDFFAASHAAVRYAAGLAANYGAGIHLLHVVNFVPVTAYEYAVDTTHVQKSMEASADEEMVKLAATVKKAGIKVEYRIRTGDVYEEIKRSIEDVKPHMVVMGTHGR